MTLQQAHRRALIELGGIEQTKETCRDARRVNWIQELLQDLRFGLRMLCKSPSFTAVVVLTLALGIGANTAIFSIVNGVMLQPLLYRHPEQLVVVARTVPRFDHPVPVSGPNFLDWRARATQFQSLAGFDGRGVAVMLGNQPENISGAAVSSTFFSVLQVTPEQSRYAIQGQQRSRTMPVGHKSQSEDDWAFAKRALARGDDPEEVIRRIADYRADDKHDPEYYAQYTVLKAQARLKQNQREAPLSGSLQSSPAQKEPHR